MVEGHTNRTTMFLQILFLICSVCNTYGVASTASPSCTSDEYRAGQVCCLACSGGYRVHRDCTATTITLCSKCPDDTFKEGLSGQKQCSACTECVTGQKVKKRCTPTSDTECEILDGFFCSDSEDEDSFSGATLSCQPHTICDSVGGVQIKPGTDSTDSTCFHSVAIVFIIIGCIFVIILIIVLGALVCRRRKMELDLTEMADRIDKMETPEQVWECWALIDQLKKKKKTPEQKRKLGELIDRHREKNERLEQDKDLTGLAIQIDEMERTDHWVECYKSADEICATKKETQELETEFYELISKLLEETPEQWRELKALICRLHKKNKTKEQQNKFDELFYRLLEETPGLWTELRRRIFKNHTEETPGKWPELEAWINVLQKETPEQETQCHELDNRIRTMKREKQEQHGESYSGAAGEGTSRYTSPPLLCPEPLAGLETSIPPALSTETQPAEETAPLMSSESPAPTGDQQEHTSRTTPDGHDDDQSLGPEDDVIRRDISASQSIPSTSQSSPSTSQSIPSTSQSSPSTSQSIPSSSQSIPSILPSARRSGAGERDIEMGPVPGFLHTDSVSLLKGNDITGDKVTHESESDDSNSETRGGNTPV